MHWYCTKCQQETQTKNKLWCFEDGCPIGKMSALFDKGDNLGQWRIIDLIAVFPHKGAIYHAKRKKQDVFLKVVSKEHIHILGKEIEMLKQASQEYKLPTFISRLLRINHVPLHRGLLTPTTDIQPVWYRGQEWYVVELQHVDGRSLSLYTDHSQQLEESEIGWLALELIDILAFLHDQSLVHGQLTLKHFWVATDEHQTPRPLILDLGPLGSQMEAAGSNTADDSYVLGLILHELLFGKAQEVRAFTPSAVRSVNSSGEQINSATITSGMRSVIEQAVASNPDERQSLSATYHALKKFVPPPAAAKRHRWQIVKLSLAITLFCMVLIVFFISIREFELSQLPLFKDFGLLQLLYTIIL